MTPHRIGGTGSFRFDRVFPGVGRINRSSGTSNVKEFRRRDLLLTELYEHAQLEALRAFMRSDVTIEELLEAKRQGKLTSASLLADLAVRANLWAKLDELFPVVDRSQRTAHRYRVSVDALKRKGGAWLAAEARVSDLATVDWPAMAKAWGASPADWNHLRRMLSAGLTRLLGDVHHPFRRQVVKLLPVAHEKARTPDLSPELFWRIVGATPKHVQPAYVALIATGMRVGEYLACTSDNLLPFTFAIDVPGTKTDESESTIFVDEELWPWIVAAIPSPVRYRWLRLHWRDACLEVGAGRLVNDRYVGLRIHDLRHAFAQLASDAGESTARIQAALRHASPDMTRRYEMQKARKDVAAAVGRAIRKRA